jgi:hypothetical protein
MHADYCIPGKTSDSRNPVDIDLTHFDVECFCHSMLCFYCPNEVHFTRPALMALVVRSPA